MIKMVTITRHECEECRSIVSISDTFCYKCGNNLTESISYEEDIKQIKRDRKEYFDMIGIAP